MDGQQAERAPNPRLPKGLSAKEAVFLLEMLSRLKEKPSGRLEVTVSDGRLVDVQLVETFEKIALAPAGRLG